MEETDIKRKLATIMVADIVGFSRLAATDEDWTIRALGDFRKIVDEIIERHDGRIFNTGGDSVLAEFASPVEAVRCAVDFQEASRSRNLLQPRDRQLRFRIGINLGDVMVRGTDLLGDGVNVAARLEGLAEPGGICVSGTVWDHINGKLSIGYVDIGEQSVKNIPRPVRAYHLRVDGSADEAATPGDKSEAAAKPAGAARKPPVAALLAGAAAIIVVLAGALAWQLWPKPAPPPAPRLRGETTVAQLPKSAPPPAGVAATRPVPPAASAPTQAPAATTAPAMPPPQAASPPAAPATPPVAQPALQPAEQPKPMARREPAKTFRDCANCPEMVVVPAGSFQMGAVPGEHERLSVPTLEAVRDEPQHKVTFARAFALGRLDVTRGEFASFASATGFHPLKGCQTYSEGAWLRQDQADWEAPGYTQTERDPVVCMNTIEIDAYLAWLRRTTGKDYRLPSEAEWEYAARGGTASSYYWGDDPNQACQYENIGDETYKQKRTINTPVIACSDGFADTAPGGSFKPNPFELYDMLGNNFVLTADCWNETYAGAPTDGSAWNAGDCNRRVGRKASFAAIRPFAFRAAQRFPEAVAVKRNRFGFRVALSLP
ncbi:MAG: SUMF1/EgtB/PvdO family nonheme iron enzyme [Alphaproteobacteria bacterium]|nr:SUMF1/EgtB/PvdO family nonheme iron enzyme [Alphaproteobacteria bacterium]